MAAITGCGDGLDTYPAGGIVKFTDGSVLPGGVVVFVSVDRGTQARARIGSDGRFTLGTLSEDDGAIAGEHRVSVKPEITGFGAPPMHPVLRKYQSATSSGLTFTVTPDGPNDFEVVVERDRKPKTAALPDR